MTYARLRGIEFAKPIFSVVSPEKADSLLKEFKKLLYPETKYTDLLYLKSARKMFEKIREVPMYIKPVQT